jgi:large conductance mechanosensitive channel
MPPNCKTCRILQRHFVLNLVYQQLAVTLTILEYLIIFNRQNFFNQKINTMGFAKEFKEFVTKGNVLDLAIAVVIGAAFAAIISSLVEDVITPLLLAPALKAAHVEDLNKLTWGAVKYGTFLAAVLKFIVVAFALFIIIKGMNSITKKKEVAPPVTGPSSTDQLLMEIRDALRKRP